MRKIGIMLLSSLSVFAGLAENPEITRVTVRQRWPWSPLVDIDYVLGCDEGQRVDVVVTAYNGTNALSVPVTSFSGDLYGVGQGLRHIVWDPTETVYTNNGVLQAFRVGLTPVPAPLYMIVDLTKTAGAEDQIEYLYEGDACLVTEGRFTNVWFGVTNDLYKTEKLVLRRIPSGSFGMGDGAAIQTRITTDFYAGVFEITQEQWKHITGNYPASAFPSDRKNPAEKISYHEIRGATNSIPPVDWPLTGETVASSSFIDRLRVKTGLLDFDLPTEAQWEYMCRSGTSTFYNDGIQGSDPSQLDLLGWWKNNSGNLTHVVGEKTPNAWGIYDAHGNVWEWCLDWFANVEGGDDPQGPSSGIYRVLKGGSWANTADRCDSADRYANMTPNTKYDSTGLRVVKRVP
jgi:formylglycine-generating enzyme required for sulfatase activity